MDQSRGESRGGLWTSLEVDYGPAYGEARGGTMDQPMGRLGVGLWTSLWGG